MQFGIGMATENFPQNERKVSENHENWDKTGKNCFHVCAVGEKPCAFRSLCAFPYKPFHSRGNFLRVWTRDCERISPIFPLSERNFHSLFHFCDKGRLKLEFTKCRLPKISSIRSCLTKFRQRERDFSTFSLNFSRFLREKGQKWGEKWVLPPTFSPISHVLAFNKCQTTCRILAGHVLFHVFFHVLFGVGMKMKNPLSEFSQRALRNSLTIIFHVQNFISENF